MTNKEQSIQATIVDILLQKYGTIGIALGNEVHSIRMSLPERPGTGNFDEFGYEVRPGEWRGEWDDWSGLAREFARRNYYTHKCRDRNGRTQMIFYLRGVA